MIYLEYLIEERIKVLRDYRIIDLQDVYKRYSCGCKALSKEDLMRELAHFEIWFNEKNPHDRIDITKGLTKVQIRITK